MLISFVAKNIFSFKSETEFNLFPNKTQRLEHHKIKSGNFEILRYSAIYGANGSGKSNLIKSISLLRKMVLNGKLIINSDDLKFKLDDKNYSLPISLAIEFISNGKAYYYTLTFDHNEILNEYLAESSKDEDTLIFERTCEDGLKNIVFYKEYYKTDKEKLFTEVLSDKLIQKDDLLITFLSKKYPEDFKSIQFAFDWFKNTLVIIKPDSKPICIAHLFDKESDTKDFANNFISSLNTGISKIEIEKKKSEDFFDKENGQFVKDMLENLKNSQKNHLALTNGETGEEITAVYENNEMVIKRLITSHKNLNDVDIEFNLSQESDGTKRLIDYIPAFQGIICNNKVILIDEIERSIHPITIKEIISKIALDENVKGQLIFTTHESNLLDQKFIRPDEIWFTQKDCDGSSKIYSLSDFKIHNTIDIEKGYLNGRYGGIPFLANFKDLNW